MKKIGKFSFVKLNTLTAAIIFMAEFLLIPLVDIFKINQNANLIILIIEFVLIVVNLIFNFKHYKFSLLSIIFLLFFGMFFLISLFTFGNYSIPQFALFCLIPFIIFTQPINTKKFLDYALYLSLCSIFSLKYVFSAEASFDQLAMGKSYAIYASVLIAIFHMFFCWKDKRRLIENIIQKLIYILNVVFLIALILTGTRGALLASALTLVFVIYMKVYYKKRGKVRNLELKKNVAVFAVFSLALLLVLNVNFVVVLLNELCVSLFGKAPTFLAKSVFLINTFGTIDNGRTELYNLAIDLILKKPITGYGIETFSLNTSYPWPHNIFLQFFYEYGLILGMIPVILLIWGVYKTVLIKFKQNDMQILIAVLMLSIFPRYLISNDIWKGAQVWMFFGALTSVIGVKFAKNHKKQTSILKQKSELELLDSESKKHDKITKANRNIIFSLLSRIISILLPFAIRTIIIKYLGETYLGLNSLFTSILQVFSLAELGLSTAIVYCMYKPIEDGDNKQISALYLFITKIYKYIGLGILVVGLAILPLLPYLISGEVPADTNLYILFAVYLFNSVISYFLFASKETLFIAYERVDINSKITLLSNIVMYVLQIILLVTARNYYAYIIWLPVCTILRNIILALAFKRFFPFITKKEELTKESKTEIYKMVAGLFCYKVGGICRNSFDNIIISAFLGLAILGRYGNYFYIMNSISAFLVVVVNALIPTIGHKIVTCDKETNLKLLYKISFLFEWIICICCACLLCAYQPFMNMWVGEEYMLSFEIVILFVVYFYVANISDIIFMFRQSTGIWWKDKVRPIVESVANLLMNIILVKFIGVAGVLISTIVSIGIITFPWGTNILFKNYFKTSFKKYMLTILLSTFISVVIVGASYIVCSLVNLDGIAAVIVNIIISGSISLVLFPIMHVFEKREKDAFALLKKVIRR